MRTSGISSKLILVLITLSGCVTEDKIIDTEPPTVSIISPDEDATLNNSMELVIDASDNTKVEKILVSINKSVVTILESEPFISTIDLSIYKTGSYSLKASVYDVTGNTSEDSIRIHVVNGPNIEMPAWLIASQGAYDNKIELDWEDIPDAHNYQIYRLNAESVYVKIAETSLSEFEDVGNFEPLVKVYYKVRVFNSNLEFSDFSNQSFGFVSEMPDDPVSYELVSSFGSQGYEPGQFLYPEHIRLDKDDNIYVSDPNLNRIQKFKMDGSFSEIFYTCNACRGILFTSSHNIVIAESADNRITIIKPNKQIVNQWGSFGSSDGQFFYFRQISIDDENKIYVVDHNNHRIQKFDLNGTFEAKWGSRGSGHGQFDYPIGITFYKGMVVVSSEKRIQFFTKNGAFIKQLDIGLSVFDLATDGSNLFIAAQAFIIKTDENGEVMERIGEGDFASVVGVGITSDGDIVASDVSKRKILIYKK